MTSEPSIVPPGDELQQATQGPPNKLLLETVDPSRKKLVSLESQRIVGVLDECISKIELSALLPCALTQAGSMSLGMGVEQTPLLAEHLRQVEAYHLEHLDEEIRVKEQLAARTAVQSSLRDVLRVLRAGPPAEVELKGRGLITAEQKPVEELVNGLLELRAVLLERLLTTPSEERERRQRLQELGLCHSADVELIATLEKDVGVATKDRDEEISMKDEVIQKLKDSLHLMEKTSDDYMVRTRRDAERQHQSDEKTCKGKQTRQNEELGQLRVQLNNLITEHREKETVLRKKNQKVETEIENWVQKYDSDMGKKQMELEELSQVYEEEVLELRQLEEHYAVMEVEFSQIMEERRLARERTEEEERDKEMKSQAATVIQAFWRGWLVRKVMRSKGKKSKKGKKNKKN